MCHKKCDRDFKFTDNLLKNHREVFDIWIYIIAVANANKIAIKLAIKLSVKRGERERSIRQ